MLRVHGDRGEVFDADGSQVTVGDRGACARGERAALNLDDDGGLGPAGVLLAPEPMQGDVGEGVSGELVKAPADLKKGKTQQEIEDLARSCTENLPDLSNPAFYAKYDFLRDDYNAND